MSRNTGDSRGRSRLRAVAITNSLFGPVTLARAIRELGFVQADPIRAPARAQDLILRHRVEGYRAGDLERRYPQLKLEEGVLYAYGFLPRAVWQLIQGVDPQDPSELDERVLAAVREIGETHPRQLDAEFGRKRVTNAWGGSSSATTHVLERLHQRGLLRVARRDKGIRVYEIAPEPIRTSTPLARFRKLVLITAKLLAPAAQSRLVATLAPIRRQWSIDARAGHAVVDQLVRDAALEQATVDGVSYLWPAAQRVSTAPPSAVRFLAPFDPLVWDRDRFEHLWGWAYRFEAYTPKAKRVRGYYALPLLWADEVIGWANVTAAGNELDVRVGFVNKRPRRKAFSTQLDAEIERMRVFLRPRV